MNLAQADPVAPTRRVLERQQLGDAIGSVKKQ
jgi:hypothetical protein